MSNQLVLDMYLYLDIARPELYCIISKNVKIDFFIPLNSQKFPAYATKTGIFISTKMTNRWRANPLLVAPRSQSHTANTNLFPVATCRPFEQPADLLRNSALFHDNAVLLSLVTKLP